MKHLLIALAFVSSLALAAGGEGDNTGCNGQGNPNSPCVGSTNNGGGGGSGGTGGNGGTGGSSTTTTNTNTTVTTSPWQSQAQGQNQTSVANSQSTGGNATASGGSSTSGAATDSHNKSFMSTQVSSKGNTSGNVSVVGDTNAAQDRNPVNTAVAPTIILGSDQCLVPVTGSVQAVAVGVAFGSAVPDKICELMKLSDRLKYLGQIEAAIEILAEDERVVKALKAVADRHQGKSQPEGGAVTMPSPTPRVVEGRDISISVK